MASGDKVTYYIHSSITQGPDGKPVHTTDDSLAMVIREYDNGSVDLVIFPTGGPTQYSRVREFDPDDPYLVAGQAYYRDLNSDPPDFGDRFRYANDPEMGALVAQQTRDYRAADSLDQEELRKKHLEEQKEMFKKLDERRAKAEQKSQPRSEERGQHVDPRSQPTPPPSETPNPEVPPGQPSTGSPATSGGAPPPNHAPPVDRRT